MRWRDFDSLAPLSNSFFDIALYGPRRVHFIGIGGIGMSALAFVMAKRGHLVSGSDAHDSPMLEKLRAAGVTCAVGQRAANLELLGNTAQAVIWGSAINADNPERMAASMKGVPQWHRAQLLAYFVNNAAFSIAVTGTHGKSTTSAMIAHILAQAGADPTVILGAEYPPFGSNARIGEADLIVVEADESDGSFTLLKPTVSVVTNVEPEHLENYEDSVEELWRAVKVFTTATKNNVVLNQDDADLITRVDPERSMPTFAIDSNQATVSASYIRYENGQTLFDVEWGSATLGTFSVGVPGEHNVMNALAALVASDQYNHTFSNAAFDGTQSQAPDSLADFYGVKRRFQKIGEAGGVTVYDDYAHHPTEVSGTLNAARDFLQRPVAVIFQPHRYSRTLQLGDQFGPSFQSADKIIITELYSAFEKPIAGVNGEIVLDAVRRDLPNKSVKYAKDLDEARTLMLEWLEPNDVLFTMGAGDVSKLAPEILTELQRRNAS